MIVAQNTPIPAPVRQAAHTHHLGNLIWAQKKFLSIGCWFVFDEGLVYRSGFPIANMRLYAWADVAEFRSRLSSSITSKSEADGGLITKMQRHVTLKFKDGRKCRISLVDDVRVGYKQYSEYKIRAKKDALNRSEFLAGHIGQMVAKAQLPVLRQLLEAGQDVSFGALTATRSGLSGLWGDGKIVPWAAIRGIDSDSFYDVYSLQSVVHIYTNSKRIELPERLLHNVPTLKQHVKELNAIENERAA